MDREYQNENHTSDDWEWSDDDDVCLSTLLKGFSEEVEVGMVEYTIMSENEVVKGREVRSSPFQKDTYVTCVM